MNDDVIQFDADDPLRDAHTPEEIRAVLATYQLDPYLDVLRAGPACLVDHLIEFVSHIGPQNWQTEFVQGIFYFDTEAFKLYDREIAPSFDDTVNGIYQYGMLRCFSPSLDFPEPGLENEFYFGRWQEITRNLLQIDVHAPDDSPWLYGWAMAGVDLHSQFGRPRNAIWTLPCKPAAATAVSNATGCEWVGDLSPDARELLSLKGVGRRRLRELTHGILTMFLDPDKYTHPTMDELMAMDFTAPR